jgi:hypothetical protein
MKGFENSNDIRMFIDDLIKSKQLGIFQKTKTLIREYFPSCDFYLATLSSASNKRFLSIGNKNLSARRATSVVFRFKPSLGRLEQTNCIYLDFSLDKPEKNSKLRQEVTTNDSLNTLKVKEGNRTYYRIHLHGDLTNLESVLKIITKSKLIVQSMEGGGYSPDDYESNRETKSTPQPRVAELKRVSKIDYPKSDNLRLSYLDEMKHQCELNQDHQSFISKGTNKNYVEAHHLIPVSKYAEFEYELDRQENLVSLCPNCHRLLHYGQKGVANPLLVKLYNQKIDGLKKVGIGLPLDELLDYYSEELK